MIRARTRALLHRGPAVALLSALAALIVTLFVVSPAAAATSLRITSPLAGTTVAGDLIVRGEIRATSPTDVTVSIAPQSLGECGIAVAEQQLTVAPDEPFSAAFSTLTVKNGQYCVLAVADGGRLSTAVGDVTIDNGDALQLPTFALEEESETTIAQDAALVPPGELRVLGPVVLALAAALAVLVVGFAVGARTSPARSSAAGTVNSREAR